MKPSAVIAQCYENVRAVLAWHEIPQPAVIAKLTDRVVFGPSRELEDRLEWLTVTGRWERWDFVANHGATARSGWRERVPSCSAQAVLHEDAVEVDIDLWNPDFGAGPALLHLIEICIPGKTDPFRVARGLRKRGIEVPNLKENEHA